MNSKENRISKLETLAGIGKQKPCKLILSQILDGVKTVCCEQVIRDPNQKEDIEIIFEGVDLNKFRKHL